MDYNFETWKGSCGYAAPGRDGISGQNGNSIHFSSVDTSTNTNVVKERIRNNQSLSNNTDAITEEKYKVNDYILDTYGQLIMITGINGNTITLSSIGNIAFSENTIQGYTVPSHSGKTELIFHIEGEREYSPYTTIEYELHENAYAQRNQIGIIIGDGWKLWRYRYFGHKDYDGSLNLPSGYKVVPDISSYVLTGKDDDGSTLTFANSKTFVEYIADHENYCKIYAVFNNGLVVESFPSTENGWGIFIEKGYIESIDKNLTTLNQYSSFEDELKANGNDSSIRKALISSQPICMCNMYFEYSHNNVLYRMNIKVI